METFHFRSVAKWLSSLKPWKRLHNYQHSLEIEDNIFLALGEKMHISSFYTRCIVYILDNPVDMLTNNR